MILNLDYFHPTGMNVAIINIHKGENGTYKGRGRGQGNVCQARIVVGEAGEFVVDTSGYDGY